jgi:2-amino-4-hydroxy-6-hydroxymethyldihydropteridine diphosphokinase
MNKIYLLLGSNMGNSKKILLLAATKIEKKIGQISHRSNFYQTAAWGKTDQADFLNKNPQWDAAEHKKMPQG